MKQKHRCGSAKNSKSYPLNQCAMYRTTSRSKLEKILLQPLAVITASVGAYSRFPVQPKYDPFSSKKPRRVRNVQKPKDDLLRIHNRMLRLLKCVQVPDYMQAALAGTSYRKNAELHVYGDYVATLDIKSFFEATNKSRIFSFFNSRLECPGDIADIYSRLVACDDSLPTGSPLSPIMSFYANSKLFDAINDLAQSSGLIFTCYIDDLTFSGESIDRKFICSVESLIRSHGHKIASRKTKLFKPGATKHVTGVVLADSKVGVPSSRFRKLRMINAALRGKGDGHGFSQGELLNIRAGVAGEIAYLDADYQHLAKRSIDAIRKKDREILGDGKLVYSTLPCQTPSHGVNPPWIEQRSNDDFWRKGDRFIYEPPAGSVLEQK